MPLALDSWLPAIRHVVVCQAGQRLDDADPMLMFEGNTRYLAIFIAGNFTLDEANAFAVDTFDKVAISNRNFYFRDPPWLHTMAFSCPTVPEDIQYVVDNFSTVDFVDAYTFWLTRHMIEYHFRVDQ